jgi:hypothetical protein
MPPGAASHGSDHERHRVRGRAAADEFTAAAHADRSWLDRPGPLETDRLRGLVVVYPGQQLPRGIYHNAVGAAKVAGRERLLQDK